MVNEVTIITPVYKTAEFIPELYRRICGVLETQGVLFRILFVDDRSPDHAWAEISKICETDSRATAIRFSRNFGQWVAISAGIENAPDGPVVVMDCDLEDPPEAIPELLAQLEHFDIIYAHSHTDGQSLQKTVGSRVFYRVWNFLRSSDTKASRSSFICLSTTATRAFRRYPERERSIVEILSHMGLGVTTISVSRNHRSTSSYTFRTRLRLAVSAVFNSTTRLLHFGTLVGFFFSFLAITTSLTVIVLRILGVNFQTGWVSLIVAIMFFSSLNLIYTGFVGLHTETIFKEVKSRPLYIISETANLGSMRDETF